MKMITLCAVAATMLGSVVLTSGASNATPFSKDAAISQPGTSLVQVRMTKKQRMMAAKKKKKMMMRDNMNSGSQMNGAPMNNSAPMNNGGRM
jgi:hypothetical protein